MITRTWQETETRLPVSGCLARVSRRGTGNRPVLEMFAGDDLVGVMVAGAFAARRPGWAGPAGGVIRGRRAATPWALAWGCLEHGRVPPVVAFRPARAARLFGRAGVYVEPAAIAGTFWVGEAAGRFPSVAVGGHRPVLSWPIEAVAVSMG